MGESKNRRPRTSLRRCSANDGDPIDPDILQLLHTLFPHAVVELPDNGYDIGPGGAYPMLSMELAAIDGALLLYERDPVGGPAWSDETEAEDDPPTDFENARSYHLMFLALNDERFQYSTDDEVEDEWGLRQRVEGIGRIGCTVAISLLAPVAMVKFGDMQQLDDGSETLPQIEDAIFDLEGHAIDSEQYIRNMMGEEAFQALGVLAERIATALAARGIRVLSKEQLDRQVPGLRAGDDTLIDDSPGSVVTVRDAFFFEQL